MRLNLLKYLSALVIVISFLGANVDKAKADTPVSGDITGNTVWTADNNPYYVTGSITVKAGATLTIQPGTVVKFAQNRAISVLGALNVNGASGNRVYFTDYRDDTVGGDSNGDSNATTPAAGSWYGIIISDGGAAAVNYAEVRYAGLAGYAGIDKTGTGNMTLTNSVVTNCASHGITVNNSSPTIQNNTITGNTGYGLYITGLALPASVTGNSFSGNAWPVRIAIDSSSVAIAADNVLNGPLYIEGETITRDITWSSPWTYYLPSGILITTGKNLTIGAGRVIKLGQNRAISVLGALNVNGASGNRVYFTDYRDDTVGGDSNGDSNATTPAAGSWYGIIISDGGAAAVNYAEVRYAGLAGYAGIDKTGTGNMTLTNSVVTYCASHGLSLINATGVLSITGSTFSNNAGYGIYVNNSSPVIHNNYITGNTLYGLYVNGLALPSSVTGNSFSGNAWPVAITANSSGVAIATDNNFNGPLPLYIEPGAITRDTTWSNTRTYYLPGGITIAGGKSLTIAAGRVVKLGQNTRFIVSGTLNVNGESGNRVYFTDYRDDTQGGDSNGDGTATTAAAGWWYGIYIADGGAATVNFAEVRYAGNGGESGIFKTGTGNLTLTNSIVTNCATHGLFLFNASGVLGISANTFSNNAGTGITVNNSSPAIQNNSINNNTGSGIYLEGATSAANIFNNRIYRNNPGIQCVSGANPLIGGSSANGNEILNNTNFGVLNTTSTLTVNATYNWWGNSSGPYHPTANPSGTGNSVSDYVDFAPYRTTSLTTNTLTIAFSGTGGGTVTANPPGASGNAGWTITYHGETTTLSAQPNIDAIFAGWSGAGCSGTGDCILTVNKDLTVTADFTGVPPTTDFSGAPLAGFEPLVVKFTDLSGHGPLSWLWAFGDTKENTAQHPTHGYEDPGTYTVALTATNSNGSVTASRTGYVTVQACPNEPASILPTFYATLQAAYDAADSGATIRVRYKTLGSLNLNNGTNVTLKGGYDCPHEAVVGITTLNDTLTITTGSAVVENIAVK
jgi:parallel beta-helix repeat protein